MKKLTIAIVTTLLIILSGCSNETNNKPIFGVVGSNVTIREDPTGAKNIVLIFEVSNLRKSSLYFKESNFDIVNENGKLIDTIQSVSAYPPIINPDETAVYYGAKVSNNISDTNIKLTAIPHIEVEKSKNKRKDLGINGVTGDGKGFITGLIENTSSKTEYKNVHVAIIRRTQNNEADSVVTATIDSLKPSEQIEFRAEDIVEGISLDSDIMVTTLQNFAYILP